MFWPRYSIDVLFWVHFKSLREYFKVFWASVCLKFLLITLLDVFGFSINQFWCFLKEINFELNLKLEDQITKWSKELDWTRTMFIVAVFECFVKYPWRPKGVNVISHLKHLQCYLSFSIFTDFDSRAILLGSRLNRYDHRTKHHSRNLGFN